MQPIPTKPAQKTSSSRSQLAGKTILAYLVAGALWVILLDIFMVRLVDDPVRLLQWQAAKDTLFIAMTAVLLYLYLRHLLHRQQSSEAAFLALQRGTTGTIGQDYFQFLTENLPDLLQSKICFIGEWNKEADRLEILAGHPAEIVNELATMPLHGTLCKQLLQDSQAVSLSGKGLQKHQLADILARHEIHSFAGVPLLDSRGQTLGLLATLSDSPPQHSDRSLEILQAFAARASSELERLISERHNLAHFEQFATLFDSLHAIIYVADLTSYELLYVNRYAEQIFGNDWQGRKCYSFFQEGQKHACLFCTNLALLVDGEPGPPVTWEFCNTRNKRWYQCLDKCITWSDGRLARLEIALDITDRKEMEQTKEELLSAVSHEMRTPLTAITGFTELLLEEEELPDHVRQYIHTIFNETEKMTDLVNTFLELRRLKSDQSRVNYEDIEIRQLLERSVRSTRECGGQHQLKIHCPDDLHVFGNRKELSQVAAKLLSNACRFSPRGGTVDVRAWREKDEVILRFEDTGIGIPPEEHQHIFEHFHRLDRGNRRRTGGTGLGLSLVKETVNLHGGRVWVESQPGRGSRFYVALPCRSAGQPRKQDLG